MDRIFDNIENCGTKEQSKLTDAEFITKAKALLKSIHAAYAESWESVELDMEDEANSCERCGGMLYVEEGGDTVDCRVCKGTGMRVGRVLNASAFIDFLESELIFEEVIYQLMSHGA